MKLLIIGFCLMAVSLVGAAITSNNWFTIPLWIGLIFALGDGFTQTRKGTQR